MMEIPAELGEQLREYGQSHIFQWWPRLSDSQRIALLEQLEDIDLPLLQGLLKEEKKGWHMPSEERITPIPVTRMADLDEDLRQIGENALKRGEVASLVVAGGQGTRLGFPYPKGMLPITPIAKKSLFQLHCEKVLAVSRRHSTAIPLLVMTSHATDMSTRTFFEKHQYFGLSKEEVRFFRQGTMPVVSAEDGKLLMAEPGQLHTSPNGHGGVLPALFHTGLLDRLLRRGVRHLFYFQVDNPLTKIADPYFLGKHIEAKAHVSSKVIPKKSPEDKLGNLVLIDGKCSIIEYSDMPKEMAVAKDSQGKLKYGVGNPAIHIFDVAFLRDVATSDAKIPYHLANKKVPYLDVSGQLVEPETENAYKFEMFVFDLLPLAERWTAVETSYEEEFSPVKNESGANSPDTARQAMIDLASSWLRRANVPIENNQNDPIEISPLFALEMDDLKQKNLADLPTNGPIYLK